MNAFALRRALVMGALATVASTAPMQTWALCASPKESGRWHNTNPTGDPAYIDVKMVDCGDQVLNGEQTKTRYTLKVWVKQSSGKFYGRPAVNAVYRTSKGVKWLYGRVPTGGYEDQMWLRALDRDGKPHLHVLIKHQSLDSKPSSTSEHWYGR